MNETILTKTVREGDKFIALECPTKIDLLDHGHIRYLNHMGSDLDIVRRARQSYDADWRTGEDEGKDKKLINRLLTHGHNTPFESPVVEFEIKAPIFVFRQWHRHRTQSYNEVSARYTELPEEVYVPSIDVIGKQHASNKQMREIIDHMGGEEERQREEEIQRIQEFVHQAFELYHWLIERGWPRELARGYLPLATYSRMSATANLHNWMRFLKERLHPHAQYEIRVYAEAIASMMDVLYPTAMAAFREKYKGRFES